MIDPDWWDDDIIFKKEENNIVEVDKLSKNAEEKIVMNEGTRLSLLKYLNDSKRLIENASGETELENQCNQLIDKFKTGDKTVYYMDKLDFIHDIKDGKWFMTGVDYTYAHKFQYFDDSIYEFFIGYYDKKMLYAGIGRITDSRWFIGDDLLFHYYLSDDDLILFSEDPDDCGYKTAPVYNDKNKIDEEKLITYILNLDILKGNQFLSREEYYDILDKLKNKDTNDLPKLCKYPEC